MFLMTAAGGGDIGISGVPDRSSREGLRFGLQPLVGFGLGLWARVWARVLARVWAGAWARVLERLERRRDPSAERR
eukprot:77547-Prorocentrum_minimum.AAC.4